MADCTISQERDGDRKLYRIVGVLDRVAAWTLRERIERDLAGEVLLDFTHVRDFSDLGVAVLAHGLTSSGRRVLFRGLGQHQLRIFRSCGVAVDELSAREAAASASARDPAGAELRVDALD
jgi:anti-anti-sigma regulatory factor